MVDVVTLPADDPPPRRRALGLATVDGVAVVAWSPPGGVFILGGEACLPPSYTSAMPPPGVRPANTDVWTGRRPAEPDALVPQDLVAAPPVPQSPPPASRGRGWRGRVAAWLSHVDQHRAQHAVVFALAGLLGAGIAVAQMLARR